MGTRWQARAAWRETRLLPYALVLPLLALLITINLYPALYQIYISLTAYELGGPPPVFIGLHNYGALFRDPRLWNSILITFRFLLFSIPLELVLGMILALLLFNLQARRYFIPLLLLPIITTPVVVGYIFQYLYREDYGLISYLLRLGHLFPGFNLTAHPATVIPALAAVDIWQWTPFVMLILLAGLQALPASAYEAAIVDGASGWQTFWGITLPLLRNQVALALVFRTVDGLRIFDTIYTITRGGPASLSESVTFYLQLTAFQFRQIGYAAAVGMVLLIVGTIFARVYLRLFTSQALQTES